MRIVPSVVAVIAAVTCGSCGSASAVVPKPSPSPIPAVVDVGGSIVVSDLDAIRYTVSGRTCTTLAPYDDIRRGAHLSVSSDNGDVTVVTSLRGGRLSDANGREKPGCAFSFRFPGAPGGRPTFFVSVGDRPRVAVPVSQIDRVRIELG